MRAQRSRSFVRLAGALLVIALSVSPAAAGDEAKHDCRQGCEEAQRSCKEGCGPRDSGDLEASPRYVDCDADCHTTYTACLDACDDD
jgi:hypothetical protein